MGRPALPRMGSLVAVLLLTVGATPPVAAPDVRALAPPADHEKPESWADHWRAMARLGDGLVAWESNRSGRWRIWTRRLDGSGLRMLSPDEAGRDHIAAHVSPDGRHVAYLSTPAPHDDFKRLPGDAPAELHLVRVADGRDRSLGPARPYWQNRSVVWVDAERLIYIGADRRTRERNLRTGEDAILTEEPQRKYGMLVNASYTAATTGRPTFSPYDAEEKAVAERSKIPGCQPYFSRDGRFGFWVAGTGGPFRALDLETRQSHVILDKRSQFLPKGHGYVYYPMVSSDGRLFTFGSSRNQHGHFEADFDVFVAPLDEVNFEVSGTAVRYTFHPGQDRFPDAWLSGRELGAHEGEAPLAVHLATPPPEPGEDEAPWTFSFGDGSAPAEGRPDHVYERPGRYRVEARRGGERLQGTVVVLSGGAPVPQRVFVEPGRERLVVAFDEAIDASGAKVSLASGRAVRSAQRGAKESELVVELAEPLAESDALRVAGVADTGRPPRKMEPAELPVEVGSWPLHDAGLLFLWETAGDENLAPDPSTGIPVAQEFEPEGQARLAAHGALQVAKGSFRVDALPARFAARIAEAGALTVEFTARGKARQEPEAHLLAIGPPDGDPLLALVERSQRLHVRVATPAGVREADLGRLRKRKKAQHLLISIEEGRLRAWRGGQALAEAAVPLDAGSWGDGLALSVGADLRGGHDWKGTLEGIALYARAFRGGEARSHANAYLDLLARREPVARYRVRARLAETSLLPTLEDIAPYREALVMHEYEVLKGELQGERVRVAHWAILDGKPQPIGEAQIGEKRRLVIEPWEDHPQVESKYLSDTLDPDAKAPLFLDVAS